MAELTVAEMEQYVRAAWAEIAIYRDSTSCALDLNPNSGATDISPWDIERKTAAKAWQAAYAFTVAREEEIRQLDREIDRLPYTDTASAEDWREWAHYMAPSGDYVREIIRGHATDRRTLARLQAIKAELQHGMSAHTKEATDAK